MALSEASPSDLVVDMEGVSFAFHATPVLEDISLAIPRGDFVCIVGPNGGGKTTLLRLMLGLLRPQRGRIRVLGGAPLAVRHRIGYMPQHTRLDPQFPMRVIDVVLMGRLRGWRAGPFRRVDREVALRALDQVGLALCYGPDLPPGVTTILLAAAAYVLCGVLARLLRKRRRAFMPEGDEH